MDALSLRGKLENRTAASRLDGAHGPAEKLKASRGSETATAQTTHRRPVAFTKHALAKNAAQPNFSRRLLNFAVDPTVFGKSCEEILSVDDWLAKAPPK
jgi:hypothetical protein